MKYLVTGQGYKQNDSSKKIETFSLDFDARDSQEAEVLFIESLWDDSYTFVKTISVVENKEK
jgi:hypothetical protein